MHQAPDNPALFLFHENWTSKAHLDQHLQKPNLQAVLARVGQLVAEPPQITLWEKIGCVGPEVLKEAYKGIGADEIETAKQVLARVRDNLST